jgi:hypothetical protein
MIVLDSALRKLQIVLVSAKATNDCPVVVSYSDVTTTTYTPGSSNTATNGITAVDVVAAPAASTQREIKLLSVQNADTALVDVIVRYNDNGTARDFFACTLQVDEQLVYADSEGFHVLDAAGQVKNNAASTGPGRFLGVTTLTSGIGFTTGDQTNTIVLRLQAAGGAGGGGATAAVSGSAGGGGGSGGYAEKTFAVTPRTTYTYTIGTAGAAGAAGANDGGAGGNTTFTVGETTVTAFGGLGGIAMAAGTTILSALGGGSSAVSTNGDINTQGRPGNTGVRLTGLLGVSGCGASGFIGGGANGLTTAGTGVTATANTGSGGSGGLVLNNSGAVAGGAGGAGAIAVEEYA